MPGCTRRHQRAGHQRHQRQHPGPARAHLGVGRVVDGVARPQPSARDFRHVDVEVQAAQVLGVGHPRRDRVGVQQAAVGSPDLEARVAAHRLVAAQALPDGLFAAAARFQPKRRPDELGAPHQVIGIALHDQHVDRHP